MSTIYDEMRDVASRLMAEFRQGAPVGDANAIKYVKIIGGNGPVDNPGPSAQTPYDINATVVGVSARFVAKSLAVASDQQLTMPVDVRFIPDMKGLIRMNGNDYKIVHIEPTPSGDPVVYIIVFRSGASAGGHSAW